MEEKISKEMRGASSDDISAPDLNNRTISCEYNLKVGQRISSTHVRGGELMSGKILSRAGRATGKYKNCFNVQKDSDEKID